MIQALIGPATKLLGKFIEDKDQKNKLAHDLATLASRHAQELAKGQIAANAEQAKHPSIFVAGAGVQWLRDKINFIKKSSDTEKILKSLETNNGIYLVPAFTGLGAP